MLYIAILGILVQAGPIHSFEQQDRQIRTQDFVIINQEYITSSFAFKSKQKSWIQNLTSN